MRLNNGSKQKVVIAIVDSLDWRWINDKSTPFMKGFIKDNQTAKLNTLLGFSESIYSCLWTSAYPRNHGVRCSFYKKEFIKPLKPYVKILYENTPELFSIPFRYLLNIVRGRKSGKIKNKINHNEGRFNFKAYLNKKSYYIKNLTKNYQRKYGPHDLVMKKQFSPTYRFLGIFVEKGKYTKLILHPFLTFGMLYIRLRVAMRYVFR